MSNLCGMPYEEGGGYSTLWNEKRVRVRKEHRCCECEATIALGEQAGKFDELYDGSWSTWYRCAACLVLAELVATLNGECPLMEGLSESVANYNWGRADEDHLPDPVDHRAAWRLAGKQEDDQ